MPWQTYAVLGFVLAMVLSIPLIAVRVREMELSRAGLGHHFELSDEDMITHMSRLLGAMGYRVQEPAPQESAFDLVVTDGLGHRRGVLVRNWRKTVDEPVIRELARVGAGLEAAPPMVVTIERYTRKAREAATGCGMILWTLSDLAKAIGQVRENAIDYPDLPRGPALDIDPGEPMHFESPDPKTVDQGPAPKVVMQSRRRPSRIRRGEKWSADTEPRCPRCGRKMENRRGAQGEFWRCQSFPRCLGTRAKT